MINLRHVFKNRVLRSLAAKTVLGGTATTPSSKPLHKQDNPAASTSFKNEVLIDVSSLMSQSFG